MMFFGNGGGFVSLSFPFVKNQSTLLVMESLGLPSFQNFGGLSNKIF